MQSVAWLFKRDAQPLGFGWVGLAVPLWATVNSGIRGENTILTLQESSVQEQTWAEQRDTPVQTVW